MNSNIKEIIEKDEQYYLPCFGRRTPLIASYGKGSYLYDEDGTAYLDLLGGIAVNVLGYGNEALSRALCEQSARLIHCSNIYYNRPQTELAEKLCRVTGYEKTFFCNSGAEANEAAIKLARAYFYKKGEERYEIITAKKSFHGRTLATLTATGQEKFHLGFKPLPEGFITVPANDFAALEAAVSEKTAAVMLEPIQGESGVYPMDKEYIRRLRDFCDEQGILLIFDEIQTGMGRTGAFLAAETLDVKADITTLAKGLGGGVPIGAVLTDTEVAEGFSPGMHGTTFGGNPLACTAALAVLSEYERLHLTERAGETGAFFRKKLEEVQEESGKIAEVRGRGLMLAFDLKEDRAAELRDALFAEGVLVNSCTPRTIRLLPPLILKKEEIEKFIDILKRLLAAIS